MAQTKYTDGSGVSEIWLNIKNYVYSQLLGKADASHTHTKSQITDFPTLSTVATSGSYNDLSNKPTIPTVNNATLTIQKNGTTIDTFTANSSTDKTVNITVPTKVSEVSNDLNYIRSLNNYMDFSWSTPVPNKVNIKVDQTWLGGILTTANTTIPTVYDTTLTIQKNGTTIDTFTANSSIDKTVNITVPTKTSDLTNDSGFLTGVTWNDVSNKPAFATVATSGSYNDLSNKPTISYNSTTETLTVTY